MAKFEELNPDLVSRKRVPAQSTVGGNGESKGADAVHGTWAKDNIKPKSSSFLRMYIGPLLLMLSPPFAVIVLTYTILKLDGSGSRLLEKFLKEGVITAFVNMHPSFEEMAHAMKYVVGFMVVQLIFMPLLPGEMHVGPVAPSGHRPIYKANGIPAFFATIILWIVGSQLGLFSAGIFYEIALPMYGALSILSAFACLALYLKGRFAPSTPDNGTTCNFIFDYFWGTELYPRFGHWLWSIGWDVKHFTNCRWGLMVWGIATLSFAAHQYKELGYVTDSMIVSVVIQEVYLLKFYHWEMGYVNTMDIQHDRAGFYICWGCLTWVPAFYTCHTLFLAAHPVDIGLEATIVLLVTGVISVWVNFDCDNQKIRFRASEGKEKIWGKIPKMIKAKYVTEKGETKESLLLLSGWWGISRHFHYLPELLAAFAWCAPTLWKGTITGFLYSPYLAWLLFDRAVRDDHRCRSKYGVSWTQYCKEVPHRIIPWIF